MGKWAEGESDWALVPATSWGNNCTELNSTILDRFDGTQLALVEIPYPRRKLVASFFPALLWICWGVTMIGPEGAPLAHRWFVPIFFGGMAVVVAASALSRASRPDLAVFEEGIALPLERFPAWSSPWSRSALGFFPWDEVSYCRWSRYALGMLIIQVTGRNSPNKLRLPPIRLEYRVSEEYRPSVEMAIRATGKWAE